MNKEGIWSDGKLIDKDVAGFCIYELDKSIHIIYSTLNGELKYCTFLDQHWMGKVIYELGNMHMEINDINVVKTDHLIHIFCLLVDKESNDLGIILHCIWNGKETNVINQQNIILLMNINEYYLVNSDENNNIDLLFISDEGNEISVNHCSYSNSEWSPAERLYGILGNEFEFSMIKDQSGMHILNKFADESSYRLEHVLMKCDGEFANSTIHSSEHELTEISLLKNNDKIYGCWLNENKVYASVLSESSWSLPVCINEGSEEKAIKCYLCTVNDKDFYMDKEVYAEEFNFNLIFPYKYNMNKQEKISSNENNVPQNNEEQLCELIQEEECTADDDNKHLTEELSRLQSDNIILMQTIMSLNMQLQNQKNVQMELESIYKRLENENIYKEEISEQMETFKKDIKFLSSKMDKIIEDNIKLNKALEFGKNFIL